MLSQDPYYTLVVKSEQMTFNSFIGNAGGLMSLCMGMSFVSIGEMIYHVVKVALQLREGRNKPKEDKTMLADDTNNGTQIINVTPTLRSAD